jgi:cell division protein FtsW
MATLSGRSSVVPRNTRARRSLPDDPRPSATAPENRSTRPRASLLSPRASAAPEVAPLPAVLGPPDPVLGALVVAILAFGIVMVYSASAVFAYQRYHGNSTQFLVRQGIYALIGLPLMAAFARIDYHHLRRFTYLLLLGSIGLLCVTAFGFGHSAGGAARWISLGYFHIQPSEVAKVAIVFWLAYSLSNKGARIKSFSVGFLPHVIGAGAIAILCLRQPDFGSAVMIGLITCFMLFTAGARLGYLLGAALVLAPIGIHLVTGTEYRMRRIQAFLAPFEHRRDAGYQLWESFMGFGSGGLTGVGIGDSRQKLMFLPEAHTDFISAIVAEELGLIGFTAMAIAFGVLIWRGLRAAFRSADEYGLYLATGITLLIGAQAFTNLAVSVGLFPTKGLVLPFISYGGSSLLVNCAAMGVVLNVSRPRAVGPESALRRSVGPISDADARKRRDSSEAAARARGAETGGVA